MKKKQSQLIIVVISLSILGILIFYKHDLLSIERMPVSYQELFNNDRMESAKSHSIMENDSSIFSSIQFNDSLSVFLYEVTDCKNPKVIENSYQTSFNAWNVPYEYQTVEIEYYTNVEKSKELIINVKDLSKCSKFDSEYVCYYSITTDAWLSFGQNKHIRIKPTTKEGFRLVVIENQQKKYFLIISSNMYELNLKDYLKV